jgi:hypothetical protein
MDSQNQKRFMGTILNRRRYMRLIREHLKTCELKPRKVKLDGLCEFLVFHMSKECRAKGCGYHVIGRLLEQTPLGPFRTGAEVLEASTKIGQEFKTGMGAAELDAFIKEKRSGEVYVYRFESATVTDAVEWDNRPGNNNSGFLPAYNSTRGCVRFSVAGEPVLSPECSGSPVDSGHDYHDASSCSEVSLSLAVWACGRVCI